MAALHEFELNNKKLCVSFGLARYCSAFIAGLTCGAKDCFYVHALAPPSLCFDVNEKKLEGVKQIRSKEVQLLLLKHKNLKNQNNVKVENGTTIFPSQFETLQKFYQPPIQMPSMAEGHSRVEKLEERTRAQKAEKKNQIKNLNLSGPGAKTEASPPLS